MSTTVDPATGLSAKRVTIPGFGIRMGPVGHLAAERARLRELTFDHFRVRPCSATIGGEVEGVDLTVDLPGAVVAELRQALLDFKVLFFRDQPLTGAAHVALARRFGELELHPFIPANDEHPELVRFEKSPEVGGYENGWHTDVTWRPEPSLGAILHAVEVPPSGGDTLFADMAAAYDGLDDDLKERIDGLTAVHDFAHVFGRGLSDEARAEMRETHPPVEHPVVRTHPETGRRTLFVNVGFTTRIVGLEPDESLALLRTLTAEAATVEYQCRFRWEPHSVAFWDNRAVQHYAASDYWPERRVMERASIVGDRPR
jgi:taurine dioxygenase